MRIMAVTALHGAFENLVMERLVEVWFRLGMTTHTKLRFAHLQHVQGREVRLLRIRARLEGDRASQIRSCWTPVR